MNYDLNVYYEVEDMIGYVGFIGPQGEFYKVRRYGLEKIDGTHPKWAEEYLKSKGIANPYEDPLFYIGKELHFIPFVENTNKTSIAELYFYNDIQKQKFNELKDLYDKEYNHTR